MDLIIDTSSDELIVLLQDKDILYKNNLTNSKHLEHLLPQIDKVLSDAQKDLSDVENFCVVVGPGSFTGVRIGVATVKAFKQNSRARILPIDMLDFLHFVASKRRIVKKDYCILIKSTSTKFYALFATKDGKMLKKQMVNIDEINALQNKQIFAYKKCYKNAEDLEVCYEDYIDYVSYLKQNKNYVEESDLRPVYMAVSQAEEELAKKERENSAKNN